MQSLFDEIVSLSTEKVNPRTVNIDLVDIPDILKLINEEDKLVPLAVEREIPNISKVVQMVVDGLNSGGRLIYLGAGTSGRLGVVDAAECPPTFGTPPELVVGLIAGGRNAMFVAQEGAEDNEQAAIDDLENIKLQAKDVVVGIAASGRTPYVKSGINFAHNVGCKTALITTSSHQEVTKRGINADVFVCVEVGPEVIAGSTRMKSGTAQKLVLNMITTATMVRLGKTYGNVMVDLQQTNLKLKERSKNIIMKICGVDYEAANKLLENSGGKVKNAIIMGRLNVDFEQSVEILQTYNGRIREALRKLDPKFENR